MYTSDSDSAGALKKKRNHMELLERIRNKEARLCVIGLGYVGLPLLVEYAKAGFRTVGIDVQEEKSQGCQRRKKLYRRCFIR